MKRLILAALVAVLATPAFSDGVVDGVISKEYGASRARDEDFDGACADTAQRGDLIDFHAFSHPGANAASESDDEWYFSFVVDSSFPLNATTGDFFGQRGTRTVTYLLGIDVGCDDRPRIDMNAGTPWRRFFGWGCDYFVGIYATGEHALYGILYDANKNPLTSFYVHSRVVGYRRHVEFKIPAADPNVPAVLKGNSQLCMLLVSTYNNDGTAYNGGRVLDAVGQDARDVGCSGNYIAFAARDFVRTAAGAKAGGSPLDPGANTRQGTTLPRREAAEPLRSGLRCGDGPTGLRIDGVVDIEYTHLTEAGFAGPYAGGSTNTSDYVGESAAFRAHYANNGDKVLIITGNGGADIRQVFAHADTNYLYLIVNGPDALGWLNEPDFSSLYIAVDTPKIQSGTGLNGGVDGETRNAPGGRAVNFKGWDPDFAVELFYRDYALLWSAAGNWSGASWFSFVGEGRSVDTKFAASGLYYGREYQQYEFAIPWSRLGGRPALDERVRIGVYTTGDENIGGLSRSNWDVYDQAPGIGQGCNGLASHERIGDDPFDNDSRLAPFNSDATPYVGRTDGYDGLPNFWQPGSDSYNKYDAAFGGDYNFASSDIDTIEEYFEFTVDPGLFDCEQCEITVECPGDVRVSCGALVPDLTTNVIVNGDPSCGSVTVTQSPEAGTQLGPDGLLVQLIASVQDGMAHTCSVYVSVRDDVPPVLDPAPGDLALSCDVPPAAELDATDACSGTASVSFVEYQEGTDCVQVIRRIWSAMDAAGNSTAATQTITVADTTAPVLYDIPAEATWECGTVPPPPPVGSEVQIDPMWGKMIPIRVSDDCHEVTVYFTATTNGTCAQTILRTWTAVDSCGNATSATQRINVIDTFPPMFIECPGPRQVTDGVVPDFVTADMAQDDCGVNAITQTPAAGSPLAAGTTTVYLVASDVCGNAATCAVNVIKGSP